MPTLGPASALARALAADRARCNALFAAARSRDASLDPAAFAALLAGTLAPVVEVVAAAQPGRVEVAVAELYPLALDLLGRHILGPAARHPEIGEAWRRLLPVLPKLVAADPAGCAAAVTNAAHALATMPGARPGLWIERMAGVGAACADLTAFRAAGAVVAWQAGLAHLRVAALREAGRLPAALAARALGLPEVPDCDVAVALARLREDRWVDPAAALRPPGPRELRIVVRAGAFRGFGGAFLGPPTIRASGGALFAADREGTWRLEADRFGAVFVPVGGPEVVLPPAGPSSLRVDRSGRVVFAGLAGAFSELAEPTSFASAGDTAAVTVRRSHAIALLAAVQVQRSGRVW